MSRTATKPSVAATWSPSRKRLQKRQSGSGGTDPFLHDGGGAHADERADRQLVGHEPGRVVVAVPAARPVDEHVVVAAELRVPAREACSVRGRAKSCAALLLLRMRDRVVVRGDGSGPRRVRED